jgi:15-cis-phytoene synthase
LLPAHARDDAIALYAWCRRCDDAIDGAPSGNAHAALIALRAEVDAIFSDKTPEDSVAFVFRDIVRRRAIPRYYVDELLQGMAMDAEGVWAPTTTEFLRYCFRVAGVVGLMMCHVMGVSDVRALPHAVHLGMAMQMTNIARDVQEDWQRGRFYLPKSWLDEFGRILRSDMNLTDDVASQLRPLIARLLICADKYYESGRQGLKYLDARSAWAVSTAAAVYQRIGGAVRKTGCDPLAGRAFTTKTAKIALAGREYFRTRIPRLFAFNGETRGVAPPAAILRFDELPVLKPNG